MVEFTNQWERAVAGWEAGHVDCLDRSRVDPRTAAAVSAHVLAQAGVPHKAPVVTYVSQDHPDYVPGAWATMSYDGLHMNFYQPRLPTVTVLHELAHLLTEDPLDRMELRPMSERAMHGPLWLQNYLWLLARHMGPLFNPFRLRATMPPELSPMSIPFHPVIWGRQRSDLA